MMIFQLKIKNLKVNLNTCCERPPWLMVKNNLTREIIYLQLSWQVWSAHHQLWFTTSTNLTNHSSSFRHVTLFLTNQRWADYQKPMFIAQCLIVCLLLLLIVISHFNETNSDKLKILCIENEEASCVQKYNKFTFCLHIQVI